MPQGIASVAYVLAGGESRRFGQNKALVVHAGKPHLVHLVEKMAQSGLDVSIVAQRATDYAEFPYRTIEDGVEPGGPLGGVIAALRDCRDRNHTWCVIVTCDLLDWRPEWLPMWGQVDGIESASVNVVLLAGESLEPFPGLYATRVWSMGVERFQGSDRSMRGLLLQQGAAVRVTAVEERLRPQSFNTVAEFERWVKARRDVREK